VTEEKALARAKSLAFRYLAVRPRSRSELAGYLAKKETPEEVISETMSALDGYGYIDDRKFAIDYGRYLIQHKGLSRYGLRFELARKGVSGADIDNAAEVLFGEDGEDEESVAIRVSRKKAESMKGIGREKARRRLIDYLRRRGFSFDIISRTLRNLDY